MINENGYMMEMRPMATTPIVPPHTQYAPPPATMYAPPHQHHHMEHKYPPQHTVVMQHTHQPQHHHHIQHYISRPFIEITHQVQPRENTEVYQVADTIPVKKEKTTKLRNKMGTARIVKRKPPPQEAFPPPPTAPPPVEDKPQKKKGRKRKFAQSREERKDNMYKNLPYINSRNKEVKPKEFEDYDCRCPLKCRKKVSVEARRKEFEAFYSLGTYTAQNVFLLERIKEINKKSNSSKPKKKTKKKSQKRKREKNFPKMSSKYKNCAHLLSDDSDNDCKDGIIQVDIKDLGDSIQLADGESIVTEKDIQESVEDTKCFGDCANEDCPHKISLIKQMCHYKSSNSQQVVLESKTFESSKIAENSIIISDSKNSYYHYKHLNIHDAQSEYLGNADQQVPTMSTQQSSLPNTISLLQVSCPTMQTSLSNTMHMNNSQTQDTISNIQVGQIISDSSQMHTQMTCVSLEPDQQIIYSSEHIPYGSHQIIYETHNIHEANPCHQQEMMCSNQISYESQDSLFVTENTQVICDSEIIEEQATSKRKRKPFKAERQFTRIYHLKKIRVCREMFVKTLKISSGRVNTVLKKNRSGDGLYRKSGNQGGHNKLTEEQKMEVYNHISSMLQYMTHNPLSQQVHESKIQQKSQFPSGYSLKSIYKVYKSSRDVTKPVSFTSYSRIFYKEFNPKKCTTPQQQTTPPPARNNTEKIIIIQPVNQYNAMNTTQSTVDIVHKPCDTNNIRIYNEEPIYANSLPVEVYTQQVIHNNDNISQEEIQIQPKKKGRKRKFGDLTRQERKYNMYRNLPYVNSRKQQVLPKEFEDYDCHCPLKCRQRVSPKERKKEFESYYNLGSYVAQNMYLLDRVEECKKKRCYIKNRPAKRERNFSRIYKLSKVRVCREMFLKTLKISSVRVNTVLNKKRSGEELTYKRGLNQGGMNRITEEQKDTIVQHINCIINSLSMTQQPNSDGDFVFPQEFTFKRMYEIYLENNHAGKCVSFSTYRRVFNEKFDFKIKNF